jgi:hypothetical protein
MNDKPTGRQGRGMLIWVAAAASLLLAGCGGGGGKAAAPTGDTLAQIAATLGCTNVTSDEQPELFAENEIQCDWRGGSLSILQFHSTSSLQHWISIGTAIAGSTGTVVTGTTWAVEADNGNQGRSSAAQARRHNPLAARTT